MFKRYRAHFLANRNKYLPYIFYPLLMPIIGIFTNPLSADYTFQDVTKFYISLALFYLILMVVIQKAIYLTAYSQPIRWLIAFCVGSLVVYRYLLLENNFLHVGSFVNTPSTWYTPMRVMLNVPILIALWESVKSAAERKKIMIDNLMLKNENAKAQLNLLLQQVNPHFLFNCLTVLQSITRSKDERAEAFIVKLGDVYRQTLKKDKGTVTLQEELDFFNAYMYLMGLRQENAVFVDVQVSDESLAYRLPVFSLQLLAENCIKHNIVSASKPLSIRLYQKDPKSLTISNNYQPKAQKKESFGIGIENLKKRYVLEGIVQGVQIEKNETMYSTTIKLF